MTISQNSLSAKQKQEIIQQIKELIDSNYVFMDKAIIISDRLDSLQSSGKYTNIEDPKLFANALSTDLVTISKDKHFVIQYRPDLIESRKKRAKEQEKQESSTKETEEPIDLNLWYGQKENFGFEKVKILEGNIGYIKFNFFHFLDWVKPTIDASMSFVSNTDALIIDLRENGGGYRSDSYIGSYFFDQEPIIWNTSYDRSKGETESRYTYAEIDGDRYLNKPIYILVGEQSFSRAEGFAYCMKHFNKAIIVGQTTPGAAHGINFLEMKDSFFIQVPVEHNMHPITKTDWEGVGVIPNITSSKEETLKVAHLTALNELINKATSTNNQRLLKIYKSALEKAEDHYK